MGLVEIKPGKGVFIKSLTPDLLIPLSTWLPTHKETLLQHFEARLILEPAASGLAALRATPSDISKLHETLDTFNEKLKAQDLVGLIKADIAFHNLIGAASGNKTIKLFMDTMARILFDVWKASLRIEGRPQKTVQEHGRILKAIMNRDQGQAQQAMERHLKGAIRHLQKMGLK
jgi:GntR family transcriptional repressor for pyruvate dehydrogenase complex